MGWFLQSNVLALERFSLLAKPAMRPRMLLRALRPPMILGASLPGMIFPAQRPAEGSNSYHYGSHATRILYILIQYIKARCFHTTMVLTQPNKGVGYVDVKISFHTTMVLTQLRSALSSWLIFCCFHTTMVLTQHSISSLPYFQQLFPYHYGSHATSGVWYVKTRVSTWMFPYHYGSHAT